MGCAGKGKEDELVVVVVVVVLPLDTLQQCSKTQKQGRASRKLLLPFCLFFACDFAASVAHPRI